MGTTTITQLPPGTSLNGTELFESVQDGQSVRLTAAQIAQYATQPYPVSVSNGGTGSASLTGYVKGAGITPLQGVATIPLADISGAGTAASKDLAIGTAAPSSPDVNDLWVDTSSTASYNPAAGYPVFSNPPALLSDVVLSYTPTGNQLLVTTGMPIITSDLFAYTVAASGASDHHVTTAGGVKLYILPGDEGYNAKARGAVGDGVADDTAAIQFVFSMGWGVIPAGTYRVTSSITYGSNTRVVGAGRSETIIRSEVIGGSLFRPTGDPAFVYIADMELRGNSLTGASGNGHAISLIDALSSGGTFSPQMVVLERLEIRGFRGQDIRETSSATTICAAGVAMYNCLQNAMRDVLIEACGHGVYAHLTQNCRVLETVAVDCDKMALFALDNENLIVDGCDLIASGDGVQDPGYPVAPGVFGSCVLLDHSNNGFVLRNSKMKNTIAGSALIRSLFSNGSVYDSNWLRASAMTDVPHKGMYVERSAGIRIINNTFHPAASSFPSRKIETIDFYTTSNEVTSFTIEGNTFGDLSGQDIDYNIRLSGNSTSRAYQGSIRNNQFGFRSARASATVVDADIVLSNCSLTDSEIRMNNFYAATNVTRTVGITASSITNLRNDIGPNKFTAFGGTITAELSGIRNDRIDAAVTYNPPSLADGARDTTTVTVTGAAIGDMVTVSTGASASGVLIYGFVSAANTVTVVFQNNTGGTVDLPSSALNIAVWRYKGA